MKRALALLSLICYSAGRLPAQQAQVSGPVEGLTFDAPTGSFRSVIGFPGSATFSGAILGRFDRGFVAPQQNYGLAFRDGKCAVVTGLGTLNPSDSELSGVSADLDGVAWSGDGSRGVLFSRAGKWIRTLAGFPGAVAPEAPVDLSFLDGSLSAIAADASGKRIAIGIAGVSGGVYLITDGGGPVPVMAGQKPIALAFSSDGSELYALDSATLQLTALQLGDFTSYSFSLDGLTDPIAIKPARDAANRRQLLVAGRRDNLLRIYDAASRQIVTDVALDFPPSDLGDFGRDSLLLAPRRSGGDPLWLFTTTPRHAVFFVPAAPAASGEPQ